LFVRQWPVGPSQAYPAEMEGRSAQGRAHPAAGPDGRGGRSVCQPFGQRGRSLCAFGMGGPIARPWQSPVPGGAHPGTAVAASLPRASSCCPQPPTLCDAPGRSACPLGALWPLVVSNAINGFTLTCTRVGRGSSTPLIVDRVIQVPAPARDEVTK
jgi:hypothetical protein